MKKILSLIIAALVIVAAGYGQSSSPGIFNYQGVARNSVGNVLINQTITLRLSIRDVSPAGIVVYQESRTVTTNPFGLFNVQVGSAGATGVTGTIAGVGWGTGNKYIQVEIDPNGGTTFINIGTAQLASVPYSQYSSLSNDLVLPFNKTQADAGTLFRVNNSGTGAGIAGSSTSGFGVFGTSNTSASGRFQNTNVANTFSTLLVSSVSTTGVGLQVNQTGTGQVLAIYGNIFTSAPGSAAVTGSDFSSGGASPIELKTYGVLGQTGTTGIAVGGYALNGGIALRGSGGGATGYSLSTNGNVKLAGINEALNRILASDASGNASWKDPSVIGMVTGSGTLNFIPKWTPTGTNLANSIIFDNGTHVGINTTSPKAALHVADSSVVFTGPAILPATATPPPVSGAGTRMMWYADKAAFRAGGVDNSGFWDQINIGNYSFAVGYRTKASGDNSMAMGSETTASGDGSTAMGGRTVASGIGSTAMGGNTRAVGVGSTAMGINTRALGDVSTAIGFEANATGYASVAMGNKTLASGDSSTAFGTSTTASGERSTAMGYNTIAAGTNSTAAGLYTTALGGGSTAIGNFTIAAGVTSTAMGTLTIATGIASTAMGDIAKASGFASTAMGFRTLATGDSSMAMGAGTVASGDMSTAIGHVTNASGFVSTAMGDATTASGSRSTAMGVGTTASGLRSFAMGTGTLASGQESTAMGSSTIASGINSTAIGNSTIASGNHSTAMGTFVSTNGFTGSFIIGDHIISGGTNCVRDNEFRTRFDGGYSLFTNTATTTGVFMLNGANAWSSISDSTKKENFKRTDGEYVLNSISNMRLGSWNYRSQNAQQFRHYGPMAQEFDKAFGNDGIGKIGCDTLINSADIDGIMMIGLQALEKRSMELAKENVQLKEDNLALQKKLAGIEDQLAKTNTQLADKMALLETKMNEVMASKEKQDAAKAVVVINK